METPKKRESGSMSDSINIGSFRPSLLCLYNHIRKEHATITKEDLSHLMGAGEEEEGEKHGGGASKVGLDEAFERLDVDGDGEVSLDDFMEGFATFLREAGTSSTPHGSLHRKTLGMLASSADREPSSNGATRETVFEHEGSPEGSPGLEFARTLSVFSPRNRHSIEQLWRGLWQHNPELLGDFEEFAGEIASEVEGAQRALQQQREATKQEARELDEEIEMRLRAAHTKLEMQTAQAKALAETRLETQLKEKESELIAVKSQLKELEGEVISSKQSHSKLARECVELQKENQLLQEQLDFSGEDTAVEPSLQEVELAKLKKTYEDEIAVLREQLGSLLTQDSYEESSGEYLLSSESSPSLALRRLIGGRSGPAPRAYVGLGEGLVHRKNNSLPDLTALDRLGPSADGRARAGSGCIFARSAMSDRAEDEVRVEGEKPSLATASAQRDRGDGAATPTAPQVAGPSGGGSNPSEEPFVFSHRRREEEEGASSGLGADSDENGEFEVLDGQVGDAHTTSTRTDGYTPGGNEPMQFIEHLATHPDYKFKILVVGNTYVGKSSFLIRLCNNSFSTRYASTVGVDFYTKALAVDDRTVTLHIWDTAGQERFQSVTKSYYRGAHGIILMYDITQEESFVAVKSWINSIEEHSDHMPSAILLVGNKADLDRYGEREVPREHGMESAKVFKADFIETSAKSGANVSRALLLLVNKIKTQADEEEQLEMAERLKLGEQQAVDSAERRWPCCSR